MLSDGTMFLLSFIKNWRMSSSYTDWSCYFEIKRERQSESKTLTKKDHFRPLLKLTSFENAKSVVSKEANHLANNTFSFVNIGSVICFPMPIGTKVELEIAKISVSADDNLLVL